MRDLASMKLVAYIAGGVLLVAATGLVVRSRRGDRASAAPSSEARDGEVGGVQAMSYDPASRRADDEEEQDAVAPVPAPSRVVAGEPGGERTREGASLPPPPPPPLELTAAQRDDNEAYTALQAEVGAQVKDALKRKKKQLRDACWESSVGEASFTYNLSFGPDGGLLAMGLGGSRNPAAGAVGNCLAAQPLALDIAPPGKSVSVDVTVEFP